MKLYQQFDALIKDLLHLVSTVCRMTVEQLNGLNDVTHHKFVVSCTHEHVESVKK
jgi:hypothetical protein